MVIINILYNVSFSNNLKLSFQFYKVERRAKIRNRYNQVPHLTQETTCESDKNTEANTTYKRVKRLALSQQVTTRLR